MQPECTVRECSSSIWKSLMIGGFIISMLALLLFIIADTPLYRGIFRLMAFICFAVLVLSYLQIRGKSQEMELRFDKEHMAITYYKESEKTQEELFDLRTISTINRIKNPLAWKILPRSDCSKFVISFTDRENTVSLFRFEGRDLCVTHPDAEKTEQFLDKYLNKREAG